MTMPSGETPSAETPNRLKLLRNPAVRRWAFLGGPLLYLAFVFLLGIDKVGLHYDEAIVQHGAVSMLNSAGEPPFPHDRASWLPFAGRYWPVAIIPYAGAVKDYVLLLPFALFGTGPEVSRLVNAGLAAFGILGVAWLFRRVASPGVGAAVAFIIAAHPAYLNQTLYDYGVVAVWMAIVGLLALSISRYKKRGSFLSAFLIGVATGVGVWNRANFLWFLASAFVAAAIVFRKKLLIPLRHIVALICGGLLGVFPFLLFQILSKGIIVGFMRVGQVEESIVSLLAPRLEILAQVLLSDAEMRMMWNGPPLPLWQIYFFPLVLIFALIACFTLKQGGEEAVAWRRVSALTLLIFATIMLSSGLRVVDHHFVTLVPLAAVVVVLAFHGLIERWPRAWVLAISIALVYLGSALYWNVAAARGARRTGGINAWSDAIYDVKDHLVPNYKGRQIQILDWGLQNNLYTLSNGKIDSKEILWGATRQRSGAGVLWDDVVARGGVFLTNSGENLHFPEATEGFLEALAASRQHFTRVEFQQKQGRGYAELYDVLPAAPKGSSAPPTAILTASPNPIRTCGESRSATTTVSWAANGATELELRVGKPDGVLFVKSGPAGTWTATGWPAEGTMFYLQDVSGGLPLTREHTLAMITIHATTRRCP